MGKGRRGSRTDYDGAWKQALDRYLEPFLRLCFPVVHAGTDWSKKVTSRDTELQQIVRSAATGKRQVDKLVEVCRRDGVRLVLEARFGQVPASILDRLARIETLDRLKLLLGRASTAVSLIEFERSL